MKKYRLLGRILTVLTIGSTIIKLNFVDEENKKSVLMANSLIVFFIIITFIWIVGYLVKYKNKK